MSDNMPTTGPFRSGLKFGLGFSIPFVVLYVLAGVTIKVTSQQFTHRLLSDSFKDKTFGPSAGLKIVSHKPDRRDVNLLVRGQLSNTGTDIWDWVRLQVDLYDKSDHLVALCEGRCSGPLHPGESRNFSVNCGRSSDDPLPAFERYTIEIVDANYKKPPLNDDDGA